MQLLSIEDVTSKRQARNGTRVWRLPIKNSWNNGKLIEVASFATGYVRNQNSGYSNYQLNKRCESDPQYYPERKYIDGEYKETGKHLQYTTRSCKLIPNEIDRLEYLISYCLKNYYIKRANEITDGKYVSKWYHEFELERNQNKMEEICHVDANHEFVRVELEEKLIAMTDARDYYKTYKEMEVDKVHDLQTKLAEIQKIADHG
jgi:hypothetical protein